MAMGCEVKLTCGVGFRGSDAEVCCDLAESGVFCVDFRFTGYSKCFLCKLLCVDDCILRGDCDFSMRLEAGRVCFATRIPRHVIGALARPASIAECPRPRRDLIKIRS